MVAALTLRPATLDDAKHLFDWRNDPTARAVSGDTNPLVWDDHLSWVTRALENPAHRILIGIQNDTPVGVVRFAKDNDHMVVSLALAPGQQGRGLGKTLLAAGLAQIAPTPVMASIRNDNAASRACFSACGFMPVGQDNPFGSYRFDGLTFEEITAQENHVNTLYEGLKSRQHSISHASLPPLADHKEFVENHPYRHWAFIVVAGQRVGNFYLQNDNSIGLNMDPNQGFLAPIVLDQISRSFTPLPAIKSQRAGRFVMHVPFGDTERHAQMIGDGHTPLQTTYALKDPIG